MIRNRFRSSRAVAAWAVTNTLLFPFASQSPAQNLQTHEVAGKTEWLATSAGRLKAEIYASPSAGAHPILIIVLHGDAPFNKPDYQYRFAARAAGLGDVVAAAILRPGYTDPSGDTSDGKRGLTTGDNYTRDRIDMIATAVGKLQREYQVRDTVLVGHSGGAAIAANTMALHPALASAALLISCPCDLPAWRAHMKQAHPDPIWDQAVHSDSPLDLAARVSSSAQIRMIVGSEDRIAPPQFTQVYADALAKRGVDVKVSVLAGKDHEILLNAAVEDQLAALLGQTAPVHLQRISNFPSREYLTTLSPSVEYR